MKTIVITDQSEALRFLLEMDMLDKIRPADPGRPGCVGFFPIDLERGVFCVADRNLDRWTLTILEEATLEEAVTFYLQIAERCASLSLGR